MTLTSLAAVYREIGSQSPISDLRPEYFKNPGWLTWKGVDDLEFRLNFDRRKNFGGSDFVTTQYFIVYPGQLGQPFEKGGGSVTAELRPTPESQLYDMQYPVRAADFRKLFEAAMRGVAAANAFVQSRADMAWLLGHEWVDSLISNRSDEVFLTLTQGYSKRLVSALLISRDIRDPRLERWLLTLIESGKSASSYSQPGDSLFDHTVRMAKLAQRALKQPVPLSPLL